MSQKKPAPDWTVIAAVVITILAWSSAWVSIRAAVRSYSAGELALGRYLVASTVLLAVWLFRGRRLPPLRDLPALGAMGVLGFTVYNLCINEGEKTVTAGAAAFLASTIPILSMLGNFLVFREPVRPSMWIGGLVSLFGVALIGMGEESGLRFSSGALLVQIAAIAAAIYGLISKRLLTRHASLEIVTWAIWLGTLAMIPFGPNLPHAVQHASVTATVNLIILGVFPGALGYVLWAYALSRVALPQLMTYLYLVAPGAVLMGWWFLGELPNLFSLIGGIITMGGVIWANRKTRPKTAPKEIIHEQQLERANV